MSFVSQWLHVVHQNFRESDLGKPPAKKSFHRDYRDWRQEVLVFLRDCYLTRLQSRYHDVH